MMIKLYREIKQLKDGIRPPQTETVIMKRGSGPLGVVLFTLRHGGKKSLSRNLKTLLNF